MVSTCAHVMCMLYGIVEPLLVTNVRRTVEGGMRHGDSEVECVDEM